VERFRYKLKLAMLREGRASGWLRGPTEPCLSRSADAGKQFSLAILFDAERPRPYVIGSVIFVPCRRPGECQFPFHEAGEAAAQ
jgi:hypothetical protein